jgi:ribosome-binding factor A
MDERRTARVSEAVREELAELIAFELDDPRLTSVIVSEVQVSPDAKYARVKVSMEGDERAQAAGIAALEHARSYLRTALAHRLSLRHVPELHFEHDRNAGVDSRIDFLLRRARRSRGEN